MRLFKVGDQCFIATITYQRGALGPVFNDDGHAVPITIVEVEWDKVHFVVNDPTSDCFNMKFNVLIEDAPNALQLTAEGAIGRIEATKEYTISNWKSDKEKGLY